MCGYVDGRRDCEVPGCALYDWMPYRKDRKKPERSPAQLEADERARERWHSRAGGIGKCRAIDMPKSE